MDILKPLVRPCAAAITLASSTVVFAASSVEIDYEIENCENTPEHEYIAEIANEFQSAESMNEYLQQEFGCSLVVNEDYLNEIQEQYEGVQVITNTGSTRYEALESCAYHPQREEFACSMSIRQRFGFGGYPAIGAGSNEWVQICVDYGKGFEPVDTASVHVHDEQFGDSPYWYAAAIVQANERLQAQVQKGQTVRARAILSWAAQPSGCSYQPVWGNQADFRIKLDP